MKLFWWPRWARGKPGRAKGLKKCKNDPFALPFEYFLHSFPKRRKNLWIAWQLALSSSIRLARKKMLANEGPQTKLGCDSCPLYLSFIGNKRKVKIKTLILFKRSCYLIGQLPKTKEVKLRKHKDIEVLFFFLFRFSFHFFLFFSF